MEFNKNNDNNNGGDEHQQLRGSARKRTFDELTKDGDKSATGEEDQPEPEDCSNSKKNREDGNDGLNLEVCTFLDLEKAKNYSIYWEIPSL
jgi:hypothetical protein